MTMSTPIVTLPSAIQNTTTVSGNGDTDTWKTTTSPRIAFLSFFLLFGVFGNVCLIVTICHSRRFRTTTFYIFIINLAVVNLCECFLNMTILMTTSIANTWAHGDIPCRLNAFFIHIVCIETLLSLTILTTDRMVAVKFREKYEHVISLARFTLVISLSWIQSFAFSLPITVGAVPVAVEENIHYCALDRGAAVAYCAFLTILCYVGPLVLCICFFISIVKTWYKDRFAVRALLAQNNYDENGKEEPRIRREILYSNLSATVCVSWLILEGPYVATFIFKLFQSSVELNGATDENSAYAWHVDLVLLFLKFSYVLVLPTAAFAWLKELRKELRDIVLCRKNNAVTDESLKQSKVEVQRLKSSPEDENGKESLSKSTKHKENRVFQVPVLFATSRGVHIKKPTKTESGELDKTNLNGEILGMKCDVLGSKENLNAIGDDTSDYDSGNEMDPFSVSHPVSVKQLTKYNSLSEQHRSNSQPEVRGRSNKGKFSNNTVGSTSAGDSGLDLRSEFNSLPRPSLESTKEHSTSSLDAVAINAITSESIKTKSNSNTDKNDDKIKTEFQRTTEIEVTDEIKSIAENQSISKTDGVSNSAILNDTTVVTNTSHDYDDNEYKQQGTIEESSCHKGQDSHVPAIQQRKKKKRKQKPEDLRSISSNDCASSPKLPLRPPPRLAPIGVTARSRSSLTRPSSSCSNNSFVLGGNNNDCVRSQYSIGETTDTEDTHLNRTTRDDKMSVDEDYSTKSEAGMRKPVFVGAISDRPKLVSLNCGVQKSDPHEVLTPSDCYMTEGLPLVDETIDRIGDGVENASFVADHTKSCDSSTEGNNDS